MLFYPHQKQLMGHPILYPLIQNDICDYNNRCLISIVLILDEIIMNMIRNKVLEYNVEGDDSYFTNMDNNIMYIYRGSLQDSLLG